MKIRISLVSFLVLAAAWCGAEESGYWKDAARVREGVLLKELDFTEPRLMKAFLMRVDLRTPGLGFTATERDPHWGERMPDYTNGIVRTRRERTVDFMSRRRAEGKNVEIAVNTAPWTPWCPPWTHTYADPGCWIVSDGVEVASGKRPGTGALFVVYEDGRVAIANRVDEGARAKVRFAMCGFSVIMTNGVPTMAHRKTNGNHPRTAFGLSSDKRYLFLLALDGRQKEYSIGGDERDLCDMLLPAGATDAVNMDGGGSTSLVVWDPAARRPKMLNHQPRGSMRTVAVNFGITFPGRPDFLWAATEGREGEPPKGATASRFLPWAGFAVMRSGWDRNATYLCFDVGPLGANFFHGHQDKLSFNLYKGGEELVFEDGGGQYEQSAARAYGVSGYDHNTLLVDGLAQYRRAPGRVKNPIDAGWETTPERDRAVGVYDQGFGPKELCLATQRREIVFDKRADLFTLTDDVTSADGSNHVYQLLFQLPTTQTEILEGGRKLIAHYGAFRRNAPTGTAQPRGCNLPNCTAQPRGCNSPNCTAQPRGCNSPNCTACDLEISVQGGTITTASAQRTPRLAGWFIGRNDRATEPATTVFVTAPACRDHRFVTILKPRTVGCAAAGFWSGGAFAGAGEARPAVYLESHDAQHVLSGSRFENVTGCAAPRCVDRDYATPK